MNTLLSAVSTILDVQTRVSDLYSRPYDQMKEQLRLRSRRSRSARRAELINNAEYGLLATTPGQRIKTRTGPPTPDDLDS